MSYDPSTPTELDNALQKLTAGVRYLGQYADQAQVLERHDVEQRLRAFIESLSGDLSVELDALSDLMGPL